MDYLINNLMVLLIFSKINLIITYSGFSYLISSGFSISIDGAWCNDWEINDGFLLTLNGTYKSIYESFFFSAALALTLFVVDNYLAVYFLLSFFFYYFTISAG